MGNESDGQHDEPFTDLDQLRASLNAEARTLITRPDEDSYRRLSQFLSDHDEEVYRAWYVTTRPPRNTLFGYVLQEEIAQGAFGRVFAASDSRGDRLAIKVLREEHRNTPRFQQAFRRGVRSMQILTRHSLPGMVRIISAQEIPAFVAMEWVDGCSLNDAVEAGRLTQWRDVLETAHQLAEIVLSAHRLPERVLHRDLRPTNVMLRDFWTHSQPSVVVLDFDLSWHRDSVEESVTSNTSFGYLAPEQLERRRGVSTRHASVDSFGLGMTLYFLLGRRHPLAAEHRHSDWLARIENAVACLGPARFPAVPGRLVRLIDRSTRDEQSQRWDLAQIHAELTQLRNAEDGTVESSELVAEAVMAGCESFAAYHWDESTAEAVLTAPNGLVFRLGGDERRRKLNATFSWEPSGTEHRKKLIRWLPDALRDAVGILSSAGWHASPSSFGSSLRIEASKQTPDRAEALDSERSILERTRQRLIFLS